MARNHPVSALRSALARPSLPLATPLAWLALVLGLTAACTIPETQTTDHSFRSKSVRDRIQVHVDPGNLELVDGGNQVKIKNAQYDFLIDRAALESALKGANVVNVMPEGHTGFQVTGGVSIGLPTAGGLSNVIVSEIEIAAGTDSAGLKWNIDSAEVHAGIGTTYGQLDSSTLIANKNTAFFPPYQHTFQKSDYAGVPDYTTSNPGFWIVVKVELSNANGSTTVHAGKIFPDAQTYAPKALPDAW